MEAVSTPDVFEPAQSPGDRLSRSARLLYCLSRWARRRSAVHQSDDIVRTTDESAYRHWRGRELRHQLTDHFAAARIVGLEVLDFGCGTGELCEILGGYEPRSVVGIDMSADALAKARVRRPGEQAVVRDRVRFLQNERHDTIPLDSSSVDLICCFDVVEHIPDCTAVASEWYRVLRSGGRVWIWWSPWRGPFGHHLESLIPIPWVHLFFSEATIFRACARLYDDPDYVSRKWDLDPQTGRKKPNKWRTATSFQPFLNKLTARRFERYLCDAGLEPTRREVHGFNGSMLRRATRVLLPIPMLGECFTSFYIYELRKP